MAQFAVNASRFDPYKNFKFRVKWDGKTVLGVSKVGMMKRTTEVVKHREGGDPSSTRKSPGRTEYEAITLERGVTHELRLHRRLHLRCGRSRDPDRRFHGRHDHGLLSCVRGGIRLLRVAGGGVDVVGHGSLLDQSLAIRRDRSP